MRETLYIRLGPAPADAVEFASAPPDARSLQAQRGGLEQAAALAPGRRVLVFCPSPEVRLTQVAIPARQLARVLQALPYALEDQVAEDLESLHFAVGPRQADGRYPVAIVAHRQMEAWQAVLRQHGLRAEVITPEVLALPIGEDDGNYGLAESGLVQVRHDRWSGFACAPDELEQYLALAAGQARPTLPLLVVGHGSPDWSRVDWPLRLRPGHSSALSALAASFAEDRCINLLQGAYSQQQDLHRLWRPWAMAASLLLAWLLVSGLGLAIDNARLAAAVRELDTANLQRFQQLFPDQTRVVNLEAQLDQQLRALGGNGGGGPLPLLEALGQALQATPGLKLGGMQFRDGALFLSMTASDLQVLEALRGRFDGASRAQLEIQSANAESGSVQIRARLSPAA